MRLLRPTPPPIAGHQWEYDAPQHHTTGGNELARMASDQPPRRPFIPYVLARMEQRGIPEEAVDFVLQNYDTALPAGPRRGSRPAIIYIGLWNGRRLRVYVERGSEPLFVKTVAWED